MEENFNLYKVIIRAVEEQIQSNNPPAVKDAFDRLVADGNDEESAKEKIASVIAEEIYYKLKNDHIIDERIYSEKLEKL